MGRWEPDASGRLRLAALELFVEQGFEKTTVAEIAQRAGLTARTFFRYFADKREVLFDRGETLEKFVVDGLTAAPADSSPLEAVAIGLAAAGEILADHEWSTRRQAVISANAELRERELIKMANLSVALAAALRRRGTGEPDASLAAETGVAVFRVAFERWVGGSDERGLGDVVRDSFARLRTLGVGG